MRISHIVIIAVVVTGLLVACAKTRDGEYVQWGYGDIDRNTVSVVINSDISPPLVIRDIYALVNLERRDIATVLIFDKKGVILLRDPCDFSPMLLGTQYNSAGRVRYTSPNKPEDRSPGIEMEPDAILQAVTYYIENGGTVLVNERSLCRNGMECSDLPNGAYCSERIVFDSLANQIR